MICPCVSFGFRGYRKPPVRRLPYRSASAQHRSNAQMPWPWPIRSGLVFILSTTFARIGGRDRAGISSENSVGDVTRCQLTLGRPERVIRSRCRRSSIRALTKTGSCCGGCWSVCSSTVFSVLNRRFGFNDDAKPTRCGFSVEVV